MHRAFLALIIAISLFATASFAGLAVFGAHDAMGMEAGAMDLDCLGHCMASASSVTNGVMPGVLALVVVLVLSVLLLTESPSVSIALSRTVRSWRDGIGKSLLHQSLSTIVLRN